MHRNLSLVVGFLIVFGLVLFLSRDSQSAWRPLERRKLKHSAYDGGIEADGGDAAVDAG